MFFVLSLTSILLLLFHFYYYFLITYHIYIFFSTVFLLFFIYVNKKNYFSFSLVWKYIFIFIFWNICSFTIYFYGFVIFEGMLNTLSFFILNSTYCIHKLVYTYRLWILGWL